MLQKYFMFQNIIKIKSEVDSHKVYLEAMEMDKLNSAISLGFQNAF